MEFTQLRDLILGIAEKAGHSLNRLDLEMDLNLTMTAYQRDDLAAMIQFLENKKVPARDILFNVLHDLYGLREIYLSGRNNGFLPRSYKYAERYPMTKKKEVS